MSDTPETDAAIEASKPHYYKLPPPIQPYEGISLHTPLERMCMKLERERNKLHEDLLRVLNDYYKDSEELHELKEELKQLKNTVLTH